MDESVGLATRPSSGLPLAEREALIEHLLVEADRYRWQAFMELYQIYRTGAWREVIDERGEPVYDFWDDYLADLSERISNLSRRLAFERLRLIRVYHETLGMAVEELVERSPTALSDLLTLVRWNARRGELTDGAVTVEEFRELAEDSKLLRAVDVRALVEEKRGGQPMLFFATLSVAPKGQFNVEVRGVAEKGDTFTMRSLVPWPRELAWELLRRAGIRPDEENAP